MSSRVDWFFGRGLSIGCGLSWVFPAAWGQNARAVQIRCIENTLRTEMNQPHIDCSDIHLLLGILAQNTVVPWQHLFLTTNWDYLLQREILKCGYTVKPAWLAQSHIYHLNGTVEVLPNNQNRSSILLESDASAQRTSSVEAGKAFDYISWNKTFVVVGMSFECEVDKFLLQSLARVQDDLPIGESTWILVNPDEKVLAATSARIQSALPRATVQTVPCTLRDWLKAKMPELQSCGSLAWP